MRYTFFDLRAFNEPAAEEQTSEFNKRLVTPQRFLYDTDIGMAVSVPPDSNDIRKIIRSIQLDSILTRRHNIRLLDEIVSGTEPDDLELNMYTDRSCTELGQEYSPVRELLKTAESSAGL